ncbi:hypothetical protein IQ264_27440 [Phormidium sp. LEGE 05292]|uniref:hypothetical protein n=1 Tax=[Phormidium] sp. LEGE 05292 TaxID=767427 RepID=UPI00188231F9|nr:hypothetical protein [Phormidium sp. LEGE 05292]MBE9229141.1 hypothetical protein [Phormidium sp. LEGE 05292]
MPARLTKHQYEMQKETLEQEIRGIDIDTLKNKKTIKLNEFEASKWDVKKSEETIRKAKLGYELSKTQNDIQEEKLTQAKDQLSFEKFATGVNKKMLAVDAETMLLQLAERQQSLAEAKEYFQLKFGNAPAMNVPRLGG